MRNSESFSRCTVGLDPPVVLFHDAVGDGQTQTRAFAHVLGGEEGFEHAGHDLRLHAVAVVADDDHRLIGGHARHDRYTPPALRILRPDSLGSVRQDVHEDLVELAGVALHRWQCAQVHFDLHLVAQLGSQHGQGAAQAFVEVGGLQVAFIQAREVAQATDDLRRAAGTLFNAAQDVSPISLMVSSMPSCFSFSMIALILGLRCRWRDSPGALPASHQGCGARVECCW